MNPPGSLKKANQLFREGHYQKALCAYELLQNEPGLASIAKANADLVRRRLANGAHKIAAADRNIFQVNNEEIVVNFLQILPFTLSLQETLDKLCFYIQPLEMRIKKIHIFLDENVIDIENVLDCSGHPSLARLQNKIVIFPQSKFNDEAVALGILYVFDTQLKTNLSKDFHSKIELFNSAGNAWRIHDKIQHHGSFFLKSVEKYFDPSPAIARLQEYLIKLRSNSNARKCVVAGTGPSLKYVYALDELYDAIIITCNSAIYNKTLMSSLHPHIVCATDPIFHAGWGKYGTEFRAALLKSLDEFDFMIVVPTRDYHIYIDSLPVRLHDRIGCYVLDNKLKGFNLDLIQTAAVKSSPNVLTNIMIPLAASVSTELYIVGCDGKKESSGYFWSHDPSSQINKHMGDIKKEFKGFFEIDYDKYYQDHCENLLSMLEAVEAKGKIVQSRTPSYIPALSQRANIPSAIESIVSTAVDVTVVMPARNAAATIEATCESVERAATKAKFRGRIVLIDDASSDETASLVTNFGKAAQFVDVVVVKAKGLGVSGARNVGMGFINSKYTTFLDADDLLSDDSFSARFTAYENGSKLSPTIIGSFSKTYLVDNRTNLRLAVANDYEISGRIYNFKDVHNPAHISSILYKSEYIERFRFEYGRKYGEDWLFLAQVMANGSQLVFTEDSFTVYSINSESATKQSPSQHLMALFEVLNTIYTGKGLDVDVSSTKYSKGMSELNVKPTFGEKKALVVSRLIGAMIATRQPVYGYTLLRRLISEQIIDEECHCNLRQYAQRFTRTVVDEIRRFSSSDRQLLYVLEDLNVMRVPELFPDLYEAIGRDIQKLTKSA